MASVTGNSRRGFEPGSASQELPGPQHKSTRNSSNVKAVSKDEVKEEFAAMHTESKNFSLEGLTSEDNHISLIGGEGGVFRTWIGRSKMDVSELNFFMIN